MRKTWVRSLGWEDPLEKGTATHSSILAWRIPWTVQSVGSQSRTHRATFTFTLDHKTAWAQHGFSYVKKATPSSVHFLQAPAPLTLAAYNGVAGKFQNNECCAQRGVFRGSSMVQPGPERWRWSWWVDPGGLPPSTYSYLFHVGKKISSAK